MLKVAIASDHRGVHIKDRLIQALEAHEFPVSDEGTDSEKSVDYPDYAQQVARKVSNGEADRGILICGTGIGMAITAKAAAEQEILQRDEGAWSGPAPAEHFTAGWQNGRTKYATCHESMGG